MVSKDLKDKDNCKQNANQIIRFRSKEGNYRVNAEPTTQLSEIIEQLASQVGRPSNTFLLAHDPSTPGNSAVEFSNKTATQLGIKHGDMLFLTFSAEGEEQQRQLKKQQQPKPASENIDTPAESIYNSVQQLPVDNELEKEDGKILRKKDPKMCRHGDKAMCDYCMPLDPYNAEYQASQSIKHLSFSAYLKKLDASANKKQGSSYMAPLSEPDFRVKQHCTGGHSPWPNGICSKCQPSAISLQLQEFRMVDHVEFAHPSMVNTFLEAWRSTGGQRIGYLYGTYEKYDTVPLGVKASVQAIVEPPQSGQADGLSLTLPWEDELLYDRVAALCGMYKVGVIYTDLEDAGNGDGSTICKRHVDSYFLSSLEIAFAAKLQKQHPNACRWSDTGVFSSKFVSCVVTGNIKGEIDISSYQVSANAEALLDADLVQPSTNPSVMRIKEPSKVRYVPDIFYKRVNEYKLTVSENAKPAFPVDYLLVSLTHGFPETPNPKFKSDPGKFPIENRQAMGAFQDVGAVSRHLKIGQETPLEAMSDLHLLAFVCNLGILSRDEEKLLAQVATTHNTEDWFLLRQSPGWQTLVAVLQESA